MPVAIATINELIQTGTAQQLRDALAKGVRWPKDPLAHPVLELLRLAAHKNQASAIELPEKLEALLDHGTPVEFTLPSDLKVSKAQKHLAYAGLPPDYSREPIGFTNRQATLLVRAAAMGRKDLVDLLLARGAMLENPDRRGDPRPHALWAAAEGHDAEMVAHLFRYSNPKGPMPHQDWKRVAAGVLRAQGAQEGHEAVDWVIRTCPDLADPKARSCVIQAIDGKRGHVSAASIQWLEQDLGLWAKLHDDPTITKDGHFLSLWPMLLRDACKRGVNTPLFQRALAHAKQTGWIERPVATSNIRAWRWRDPSAHNAGGMQWEAESVGLPPLQALLHADEPPSYKKDYRRLWRVGRALVRAGAKPWAGQDADQAPTTDAILWECSRRLPRQNWLRKHSEFLLPHPTTGQTALHVAATVKSVEFWRECGLSLEDVDLAGNQVMASIVSRTGRGWHDAGNVRVSSAVEWAKFVEEGWKSNSLPLHGHAHGHSIAEWACSKSALFQLHARKVGAIPSPDSDALHVAARHYNDATIKTLVANGHRGDRLDTRGHSPLNCLAWNARKISNNTEEIALINCLDVAADQQWPCYLPGQAIDPWQTILSDPLSHRALHNQPNEALPKLFWYAHGQRMANENLWQETDARLLLQQFGDESNDSYFRAVLKTIPQCILDDMALSLFDISRRPEDRPEGLTRAPELLRMLLDAGADAGGVSCTGKRLVDTWDALVEHEVGLLADEENSWRAHYCLHGCEEPEVRAAIQSQKMDTRLPQQTTRQGPWRRRL